MQAGPSSYWQEKTVQVFMMLVKGFILSLIILISFFIYKIFTLLLPSLLSLLLLFFVLRKVVATACRIFTFPGSSWFWRRNNENHFRKAFVFKIKRRISALRSLIDYLLEARLWHNFLNEQELIQIRRVISSILHLYTKQTAHNTLSKKQKEMMTCFSELDSLLNESHLINRASQKKFSTWKLLQADRSVIEEIEKPNCALYFENKDQGALLLARCKNLEQRLNDIVCEKSTIPKIRRWLYDDTFGSLDQLREEIDNKYRCQRIPLPVEKNIVLDCVLISSKPPGEQQSPMPPEINNDLKDKLGASTTNRGENSRDHLQALSNSMRNKDLNSVMIICCPNAGYYECLHYENDWIEFYIKNGLSIFLWNYRGYGRSSGTPSPDALRRDGEAIVDYLRKNLKVKKIGIHGESIGGLVAIHVAREKNVDFLCADRTFKNLSDVGKLSFGSLLGYFYRMVTLWDDNIPTDYIQSNCYKVITFDPKDEVIHALSSLKYGVTKKALEGKLGLYGEPINPFITRAQSFWSPLKLAETFKKFMFVLKFTLYENKVDNQLDQTYQILGKEQTLALYGALHRISELFVELYSSHGFSALKQQARIYKPMNPRTTSKTLKPVQAGNSEADGPVGDNSDLDMDIPLEGSTQNAAGLLIKKDNTEEKTTTINFCDKPAHQAITIKGLCKLDEGFLLKSTQKKSYIERFNEQAKGSDEVLCLLLRLFPIFEDLDAGGIHISDMMTMKTEHRYNFFRFYLNCFEVWGSYLPLFKTIEDDVKDVSYYQNQSLNKISQFIEKIEHVTKKQPRKNSDSLPTLLTNDIMEDLELIGSIFSTFYQNLANNLNKSPSSRASSKVLNEMENVQEDITVNNPTINERTRSKAAKLISKETLDDQIDFSSSMSLGHLIPLTCGHNGSLKPHEMEVYEYHIRNSKLLDK